MQHSYSSSYQQGSPSQASSESEDGPPPVLARFFYPSSFSIDDSLSPSTSAAAASEPRYVKAQYEPFSWTDNHRLERAWRTLVDPTHQSAHSLAQNFVSGASLAQDFADILSHITKYIAATHDAKHGPNLQLSHIIPDSILAGGPAVSAPVCCPELYFDVENEMREAFCPRFRSTQGELSIDNVVRKVMVTLKGLRGGPNLMAGPHHADSKPRCNMLDDEANPAPGGCNPRMAGASIDTNLMEPRAGRRQNHSIPTNISPSSRGFQLDDGMSGTPFVRVDSPSVSSRPSSSNMQRLSIKSSCQKETISTLTPHGAHECVDSVGRDPKAHIPRPYHSAKEVVVGASRLHTVSLPALEMRPIYWSPVNDRAAVLRATWFYKCVIFPSEPLA